MKKSNLYLILVALIIFVAIVAGIGVYTNKTKENNEIINENQVQNEENNSVNSTKNELETELQDPVDETPASVVQTPTEEDADEVISDKPTV